MSQSTNPFLDQFAKMMTDAAGVASSAKREVDSLVKSQIDRLLRDADIVTREEFEAVREMSVLAREDSRLAKEENEKLSTKILELEAKLGITGSGSSSSDTSSKKEASKT